MTTGELIDDAVHLYQRLGLNLLGGTAGAALLCAGSLGFVFAFVLPSLGLTENPDSISTQAAEVLTAITIGIFVAAPIFLIGMAYAAGYCASVTADSVLGRTPDYESASRVARSKVPGLFLLGLLQFPAMFGLFVVSALLLLAAASFGTNDQAASGFIAVLGVVAFIAALLALPVSMMRTALAPAAMVFENLGGKASNKRSLQLLRAQGPIPGGYGTLWAALAVIGFLLLIGIMGVASALEMVAGFANIAPALQNPATSDVLSTLIDTGMMFGTIWLIMPVWSVATTLLYFERRARIEGYDIEVMAADARRKTSQARFEL